MTCPDCDGEGMREVSTASRCTRRIGECCGGCTTDEDCKTCKGTGQVADEATDGGLGDAECSHGG